MALSSGLHGVKGGGGGYYYVKGDMITRIVGVP